MDDLKSCPMCGGEASFTDNGELYFVECTDCWLWQFGGTPEKARDAWNRRDRPSVRSERRTLWSIFKLRTLKPCPMCCSDRVAVARVNNQETGRAGYMALCRSCFLQTKVYDRRWEAIKSWNRRIQDDD